jgi:predicted ABC-type transport system involved in lysophospholipase L1 biosynthesis ATPase subunit
VAVARALIRRPVLLLADEPTGALDETTAGQLADLLLEMHQSFGAALVVVTHSPELAARMGRTLKLSHGKLNG